MSDCVLVASCKRTALTVKESFIQQSHNRQPLWANHCLKMWEVEGKFTGQTTSGCSNLNKKLMGVIALSGEGVSRNVT
jgi:hypothetical protein